MTATTAPTGTYTIHDLPAPGTLAVTVGRIYTDGGYRINTNLRVPATANVAREIGGPLTGELLRATRHQHTVRVRITNHHGHVADVDFPMPRGTEPYLIDRSAINREAATLTVEVAA